MNGLAYSAQRMRSLSAERTAARRRSRVAALAAVLAVASLLNLARVLGAFS